MATTTSPKTNPFDVDFEAAAERIRGLNEKVFTAAKQTGTMSVDTYEQAVNNVLDFSQKAADPRRWTGFRRSPSRRRPSSPRRRTPTPRPRAIC